MTARSKTALKALFEAGDTLLESSFTDLIDSFPNVDSGGVALPTTTSDPTPPASGLHLYGRERAGAVWPEVQRANGRIIPLQPHFGVNRISTWSPSTSTTVVVSGMPIAAVGTVSTPNISGTSLFTSMRRWVVTSALTANAAAEQRSSSPICWRGNAAGLGGFTFVARFGIITQPANSRVFIGLHNSLTALSTSLDVETLVQCVGIGYTEGVDTNIHIFHNDGSGSVTKIDTGFAIASLSVPYTLYMYCPPNGTSIFVRLVNEDTGTGFDSELTTDIPTSATFLSPRLYMNNGGTAAACAYGCSGVYIETDY